MSLFVYYLKKRFIICRGLWDRAGTERFYSVTHQTQYHPLFDFIPLSMWLRFNRYNSTDHDEPQTRNRRRATRVRWAALTLRVSVFLLSSSVHIRRQSFSMVTSWPIRGKRGGKKSNAMAGNTRQWATRWILASCWSENISNTAMRHDDQG